MPAIKDRDMVFLQLIIRFLVSDSCVSLERRLIDLSPPTPLLTEKQTATLLPAAISRYDAIKL